VANEKGNETILLVEDDTMSRRLTRMVLEEEGYKVIEAVDGEDAIASFTSNKDLIKLIILDVILPKKNGREVYDAVMAVAPGVKVLFMSGYTASMIFKKGVLEANLNFIPKPVSPRIVVSKIREILDSA